jgi:hypothetical protein
VPRKGHIRHFGYGSEVDLYLLEITSWGRRQKVYLTNAVKVRKGKDRVLREPVWRMGGSVSSSVRK